ncbi:hypothetical protein BDA96_09G252700 [Sorghum bicolor]|uniref:Uncharacterized protein n=1 Tax=Sorghum bicolor TaxID=4558 RepID=A0A921QDV9_SORBI|nr:hypothetical protein BDA96_09G252700 [Sorghum bicolor]
MGSFFDPSKRFGSMDQNSSNPRVDWFDPPLPLVSRPCGGEPTPMPFDPPLLPVHTPLAAAAAASQPQPLLPPVLDLLLPDFRYSRS